MRTLKFIVDGLTIKQDPKCDFSGLAPGTKGYLIAEFRFSSEWNGFTKRAVFYSRLGMIKGIETLSNGIRCTIPSDALSKTIFKVQVIGKKDDRELITNRVTVEQEGGKV